MLKQENVYNSSLMALIKLRCLGISIQAQKYMHYGFNTAPDIIPALKIKHYFKSLHTFDL